MASVKKIWKMCPKCGCAKFHIPSKACSQCGYSTRKPAPRT